MPEWGEIVDLTLDFQGCVGMNQMMTDAGGVPGTGFCARTKCELATGKCAESGFANGIIQWDVYPEAESWKNLDSNFKAVENLADVYFEIIKQQEREVGESIPGG